MTTNIAALPLARVTFLFATNEDWRDGIAFRVAGPATAYAAAANTGNGALTGLVAGPGARIGDHTLTLTDPARYAVANPDGILVGIGTVDVPFVAPGLTWTLAAGSTPFAPGDVVTVAVLSSPLDLTGIRFVLQMRPRAGDTHVLIAADTDDGSLVNGGASGVIGLNMLAATRRPVAPSPAGAPYAVDALAIADGLQLRCIDGTAEVTAGITIPAL